MNKRIINLITCLLIPVVGFGMFYVYKNKDSSTVRAFGVLNVDFGVPQGTPLFEVANMMPGDCIERNVKVTNSGTSTANISVKSSNEENKNNLAEVLDLAILENSNELYTKTIKEFFEGSDNPDGIALSALTTNEVTDYKFKICFKENAGNEYQDGSVRFDLTFGQTFPDIVLPSECSHLSGIISKKIEGTSGNNKIRGTQESELIYGYGGNDDLDGNGGNDCIIAGEGKDKVDGGQGSDTIIGGRGDDELDGGSGNDKILGNDGKDNIKGGSGNDNLLGGSGDDKVSGGAGNDTLDGQENYDILNGSAGTDKCVQGELLKSCEIK